MYAIIETYYSNGKYWCSTNKTGGVKYFASLKEAKRYKKALVESYHLGIIKLCSNEKVTVKISIYKLINNNQYVSVDKVRATYITLSQN